MPRPEVRDIVGPHPSAPHPLGLHFSAIDQFSAHNVAHRNLEQENADSTELVAVVKDWIRTHHAAPSTLHRDREFREACTRLGVPYLTTRFPSNLNTQKGNWAEVVLAEYIVASCDATLPVYRLRYNPNVDQSMKGDDVLAFDLDCQPMRMIVGEAKFRTTPSKQVVEEIVEALERSHRSSLPVSLQFIAERLFEQENTELGAKLLTFSALLATDRLRIDYVGLLVSDPRTSTHVQNNAKSEVHRLAVISAGLHDPEQLVVACYDGLDQQP